MIIGEIQGLKRSGGGAAGRPGRRARLTAALRGLLGALSFVGCTQEAGRTLGELKDGQGELVITDVLLAESNFALWQDPAEDKKSRQTSAERRVGDVILDEMPASTDLVVHRFETNDSKRQRLDEYVRTEFEDFQRGTRDIQAVRTSISPKLENFYKSWWERTKKAIETRHRRTGTKARIALVSGGGAWPYFWKAMQAWEKENTRVKVSLVVLIDPMTLPFLLGRQDWPDFGQRFGLVFWTRDANRPGFDPRRCRPSQGTPTFSETMSVLRPDFEAREYALDAGNWASMTLASRQMAALINPALLGEDQITTASVYDTAGRVLMIAFDRLGQRQRPDMDYRSAVHAPDLAKLLRRRGSTRVQANIWPLETPQASEAEGELRQESLRKPFVLGSELRRARLSTPPEKGSGSALEGGSLQLDAGRFIFMNLDIQPESKASLVSAMEWRRDHYAHTALSDVKLSSFATQLEEYVFRAPTLEIPISYPPEIAEDDASAGSESSEGVGMGRQRVRYFSVRDILYLLAAFADEGTSYAPAARLLNRIAYQVGDIRSVARDYPALTNTPPEVLSKRVGVNKPAAVYRLGVLYRAVSRTHQALLYFRERDADRYEGARQLAAQVRSFFTSSDSDFIAFRERFDAYFDGSETLPSGLRVDLRDSLRSLAEHVLSAERARALDDGFFYILTLPDNLFPVWKDRGYVFDVGRPSFGPASEAPFAFGG